MTLDCLDPVTDPRWAALVARRGGGLFHSPLWLGAVKDTYGFELRAAVILDHVGEARAGIPYAIVQGPYATRLVAAPFCDSCDPLVESLDQWSALFRVLESHGIPIHLRCVENNPNSNELISVTKRARWHSVAISETNDDQWSRLHPAVQRGVRKAKRAGVSIRPISIGPDLVAFHKLHVVLRKSKYQLLAQPLSFFEAIAHRFDAMGNWHALGAWHNDRLIAGTIYLRWGNALYYKFNASSLDDLDVRPNNLLAWHGIELARELGCGRLDLGPSDDDQPGLIRFKQQFGASERELRFLRFEPLGWLDPTSQENPNMLSKLTELLTRSEVPDAISAEAGDQLYRYFA